jgi:hypothetical protein
VLESAKYLFLGVDPPRTTCAATCPVWNDLLNKLVNLGMCLAGGTNDRLSVTLGIRKVKWGSVKCGTLTHCSVTGIGFKCVTP